VRIAIPVLNGRVSPVFDGSKSLLVADFEGMNEVRREIKRLSKVHLADRAQSVADLGVKNLICTAISKPLRIALEARGICVFPNVCGAVEDVLNAFICGKVNDCRLLREGCEDENEFSRVGQD